MLQVSGLGLAVCAFICSLTILGSVVPPSGESTPGDVSSSISFISPASVPIHQPNGFQPPLEMPPLEPALAPQTIEVIPHSTLPSPSTSLPNPFVWSPPHNENAAPFMPSVPPSWKPQHPGFPPFIAQAPAPAAISSSGSQPYGQPHLTRAPVYNDPRYSIAPDVNAPRGNREAPPLYLTFPEDQPSLPPDEVTRPELPGNSRPVKPTSNEPSSSPPVDLNASPILTPAPSPTSETAAMPVAVVPNQNAPDSAAPASHSRAEGPLKSHSPEHFNDALPPYFFSKSTKHHPAHSHMTSPATVSHPVSSTSGPSFAPLVPSSFPSSESHPPSMPASPTAPSDQTKTPRNPRVPQVPPLRALPPPPPQQDCAPLTCPEPLTYGPAESACLCVLPIQVGLRLTVVLYTFFPLVSELAAELGASVFMKQSQVRIVGANADGDDPEKTIVLIDLLPLGEKFDFTTAYLTYKRIWNKQVAINASYFGDYDVLYVRYPGLPSSPPLSPPITGIIPSKPYPGQGNNGRTEQPLGVDVNKNQHKHQPSKSTLSIIILSCFVAFLMLGTVLWVLIVRHRRHVSQPDPTPPTTARSFEKSSGIPISLEGGEASSSFSFVSTIPAYTGLAKTFCLSDIEKATGFFNETRVLGEGGFGRVFSGVLQDGTKVAVKVLKRYDQQGGREFLSEVEMLSRLHHRNLVKLIGICIEDRTSCLVYELIPNGSVESHLHGFDKERSPLDWSARLKIALGAARALTYLHEDSSPRVIHRDFKASNILLEDDFTPKVSDFGLARSALDEANKHISTRVMGTFGYVAPEYAMTGHLLVKSDVYSYGVVLLELLTGKKPVDMSQPPGQENLVSWARPLLTNREDLESIIDPSLGPNVQFDSIAKVAVIASTCVQPEVSHRPFMGEVVQALKLVCNECSPEDLTFMDDRDAASTSELAATLLTPYSVPGYDYRDDFERELSVSSELLSSSAKLGAQDSESFRRCGSSGPLKIGKAKALWKTMRGVSVSEHGMLSSLWPGSH